MDFQICLFNFKVTRAEKWPICLTAFVGDDFNWNSRIAQIAFKNMEEVLYCFAKPFVKFQSPTRRQIGDFVDLKTIWAILLGQSQLSNPSGLPCCVSAR